MNQSPQNMEKENWEERFERKIDDVFDNFPRKAGGLRDYAKSELFTFISHEIGAAHSLGEKAMLEKAIEMSYGIRNAEHADDFRDRLQALTPTT